MKKILITLIACLPMTGMAQNVWEIPEENKPQQEKVKKEKKVKVKEPKASKQPKAIRPEDMKYMAGAVPEVDGNVVFTYDKDFPGLTAEQIYKITYTTLDSITKSENQTGEMSKIALVNKGEHIIAARFCEWLVFQSTALSLDRTVFNYTIIAQATDGHLHATLERINYQYEMDRSDSKGLSISAENWITDKYSLNKSQTRLARQSGKFRRKTIDRKDNIFDTLTKALKK